MDVAAIRRQIPACQRMVYMNTGWQGPSPVAVVEAVKERLEYESYSGPTSTEVLESGRALQMRAKEAVAGLLNASAEEVLLTTNTTEGLNLVLSGLEWHQGDEIITCNLEHPSVLVPSYVLRERYGVSVKVLELAPGEEHSSILAKVEEALNPRTRMVFISHIQYSTGLRMPVEGIRKVTRDRGVMLLLDAAQGAGHVAIDVRSMGCEFYSIPGQKWLLGPAGTGALYIRRDMIPQVLPTRVSSHAAHSYGPLGQYEAETDSIDKFRGTTTSAPLSAGLLAAVELNRGLGPDQVEGRVVSLAARLKGRLLESPGVEVLSPLEGPGCTGLVSLRLEKAEPRDVVQRLWDAHRVVARSVSYLPGVRVSLCHFNTEEEVDLVAEALGEMVRNGVE